MKTIFFFLLIINFSVLFSIIINIPADQPTIQAGIDVAVDADIVLVEPGIYVENINYNGKNIIIGSFFFLTSDTTYVSQTIIDGGSLDSVVKIVNGEDSTTMLSGFTITNGLGDYSSGGGITCSNSSNPILENVIISGNSGYNGGGITCSNSSNPSLMNVSISGNSAGVYGGGIHCENNSSPNLENVIISGNSATYGGGVRCYYSSPSLENVIISGNSASWGGGGIECYDGSNPILQNVSITDNSASRGGGIFCDVYSNLSLENVIISGNSASWGGGGLYCGMSCSPYLINVSIKNNTAYNGGGIYIFGDDSNLNFNSSNRSSIYSNTIENNRGAGADIFFFEVFEPDIINIIVDTFTVMTPTDYYASTIDNFTFDILHSVVDSLINADIYVSVDGADTNSGLNPEQSFKTINHALKKIYTDSLNVNTIHLAEGIYSPSTNGEIFPIRWNNYTNLTGDDQETTILDANYTSGVMDFFGITDANISNLTIRNGNAAGYSGGGIYCNESIINLENLTITGNTANTGGGIYCGNSNPNMINVKISDNTASYAGGGIWIESSYPIMDDESDIVNKEISDIYFPAPYLENVTITYNSASTGGGIYCDCSDLNFDPVNRCNIYLNFANSGCDLYAVVGSETINVIVDTFTVLEPDDYFAHPIDNFTFDILNAKIMQVNQDLFVNPEGSNNNSGLTVDDPLLSITYALQIIAADNLENHSIHLSNGIYSPSETGEIFPLNCRSYVSLLGEDETTTILDGEGLSGILICDDENDFSIMNMTVQNGSANNGGGINFDNSNPNLENIIIIGNSASKGGGIRCSNASNPSLINVTITGNSASQGGGIYCISSSSPSLQNVTIIGNYAISGCGIYCYNSSPDLVNVTIADNTASDKGGGIYCNSSSSPSLENVTITGNSAVNYGSGIYSRLFSNPYLINSIMWNNTPQEISGSVTVTYSDIQGGWAGTGNIDGDPLFVDPLTGNYHLTGNSPCIDAGDPASPLDPDSTIADMGAYYFHQEVPNSPQNVTIEITGANVHLSWEAVPGVANSYKVYSSDDPFDGFVEDTSGSFAGETWNTAIINEKKFYYVVAVN